jgi:hypothetical protein
VTKTSSLQSKVRKLFSKENLPHNRILRIALGVLLIVAGVAGFLPILGFWMIPLGLGILSIDVPIVRRWTRRSKVAFLRWWRRWKRNHPGPAHILPRKKR